MSFSRKEYAAAVHAAHDALHRAEELSVSDHDNAWLQVFFAHEALHAVYSSEDPPIDCATHDPEAQAAARDLIDMLAQPLPCGHTLGDLIGGHRSVTKCGACLLEKQTATGRFAPDVQAPRVQE